MRKALIKMHDQNAGFLVEENPYKYVFQYISEYDGPPISLTMPVKKDPYVFDTFPPFFDGLLPEGTQLEGLLKTRKIDTGDYFAQLVATGNDLVGAVTISPLEKENE